MSGKRSLASILVARRDHNGLPVFSMPVVISNACSRWTNFDSHTSSPHIKRSRYLIDNRRRNDPTSVHPVTRPLLQLDRTAVAPLIRKVVCHSGFALLPVRRPRQTRKHCHSSSHIHNVMDTQFRNRHLRQIQRLPNHLPIHRLRKELSKLRLIYVLRRQNRFVRICPRTRVVVMPRRNRSLRRPDVIPARTSKAQTASARARNIAAIMDPPKDGSTQRSRNAWGSGCATRRPSRSRRRDRIETRILSNPGRGQTR